MRYFTRFPLEIRRLIYRALFTDHHFSIALLGSKLRYGKRIIRNWRTGTMDSTGAPSGRSPLGILQVSKAIRAEAIDVAYRECEFNLSFYFGPWGNDVRSVDVLFRQIGPVHAGLMRHVCWNENHVEVSRVITRGKERLYVNPLLLETFKRLLHHLPHLRLCEVWCSTTHGPGSTWRVPGDAVAALPKRGALPLESLLMLTLVAGVPGTSSATCSAFHNGWPHHY
ncbi:hypothetical protein V2A60_008333 [Cordyceps javanica]